MEVKKERVIPLSVPAGVAWDFTSNIEAIASCMPGATITEKVGDDSYNGKIRVKIGPVTSDFKGVIEIKELNAANRTMVLAGSGGDTKGTSKASMELYTSVKDNGDGTCELRGRSVVTVTGKLATFGGRMMDDISEALLDQFIANLTDRVTAGASAWGAEAGAETAAPAPAKELNAMALVFGALWRWIKSLFGVGKSVGP